MNIEFGKKIKQLRKLNKLKIIDVVIILKKYHLDYSIQSVYKWEEGEVLPNIFVISALANIYGCQISYLLSDETEDVKKLNSTELVLLKAFRIDTNFRNISMLLIERFNKHQTKNN